MGYLPEPSNIKNHFYVLVDLKGQGKLPEYIIIPKEDLAAYLKADHAKWLSKTKRDGSPRKDTDLRVFDPNRKSVTKKFAEKYKNNWDVLNLW